MAIIPETSRLCRKLRAILYLLHFPHFCTDTDMITAYKVLIYINSCYTANKVLPISTKCYSITFATFRLRLKQQATKRKFNRHTKRVSNFSKNLLGIFLKQKILGELRSKQLVSRIRTFRPDPAHKLSANLYVLLRVQ